MVKEGKSQIFDALIERILKEVIKDYSQQNSPTKKLLTKRKTALIKAKEELEKVVKSPSKNTFSSEERDKFFQNSPIRVRVKMYEQTTPKQLATGTAGDEILLLTAKINRSLARSIDTSSGEEILDHGQCVAQKIVDDIEKIEAIALKNGHIDIYQK